MDYNQFIIHLVATMKRFYRQNFRPQKHKKFVLLDAVNHVLNKSFGTGHTTIHFILTTARRHVNTSLKLSILQKFPGVETFL